MNMQNKFGKMHDLISLKFSIYESSFAKKLPKDEIKLKYARK